MAIKALLWDFGDTLCDERFIWGTSPEWMQVYESFDGGWAEGWNSGDVDTREFATQVSQHIALSPDAIAAHMRDRCQHINWFAFTWEFFKARHLPQAIVTVNPDLFSDVIVPLHKLDSYCELIVTSWEEAELDKAELSDIARRRLDATLRPDECLLIDNKAENTSGWEARGGAGYHYIGDAEFKSAIEAGLLHQK